MTTEGTDTKPMTVDDINRILELQDISVADLARRLGSSYNNLRLILAGQRPLTKQLARHITLELGQVRTRSIIYTIPLPDGKVEALIPGAEKMPPEEVRECLQRVIDYNRRRIAMDADAAMRAHLSNMRVKVDMEGEPHTDEKAPLA